MKISDIKATFYDFFGYFLPGALLILLIYVTSMHFYKITDITRILKDFYSYLNIHSVILLSFIAYFLGHAMSTLSSFVVEKKIFSRLKGLSNDNQLSSDMLGTFKEKYRGIFKVEYQSKDARSIICYVESKQPAVYSTAFVFLSFYGMARCIAFTLSIFFICETVIFFVYHQRVDLCYAVEYLLLAVIFYYEYFRFFRYFKQEIIMGFMLPE